MKTKDNIKKLREKEAENLAEITDEHDQEVKDVKLAKDAIIKPVFLYPDDDA